MKKIKVLHILETLGPGGVERRRLSLAKKLNKSIFEQKIICTQVKFNLVNDIRKEGIEVVPIGIFKHPFHWRQHKKVQRIIDEYQPDIIHGAVFEGNTMAAVNGFFKKVPIIIVEETSFPIHRSWKGNLLMRILCQLADVSIGVSPASVAYLKTYAKVKDNKLKLINNGVRIPRNVSYAEKQELKYTLGIKENDIIIGSAGRMISDENKRFSDLIKALSILSDASSNIKLLLLGSGREVEYYKSLAESLDIRDKVIFPGYQEDMAKYYAIMDIFSLVSSHEGFGLVLVEAMMQKLPVVATRIGGMKYIVEEGKTGFLVEKFNETEIAEKLKILSNDKKLREGFGAAGFQRAMQYYTEDRYVENVEALYLEILRKKSLL